MADKYKAFGYSEGEFSQYGFISHRGARRPHWFTCGFVAIVISILALLALMLFTLDFIIKSPIY